ncbi:MAG: hypothetical protein JO362_07755 [Streptomycetaceae bacterium]|nr:hypothetical protein [Streptomycetaceae bacterium]
MRIELTWPRADAAARTLTVAVPEVPVADLLQPALGCALRAWTATAVRRASSYAGPLVGSAAGAAGGGVLVQLALPFAIRLVQQALDDDDVVPGADRSPAACVAPVG